MLPICEACGTRARCASAEHGGQAAGLTHAHRHAIGGAARECAAGGLLGKTAGYRAWEAVWPGSDPGGVE